MDSVSQKIYNDYINEYFLYSFDKIVNYPDQIELSLIIDIKQVFQKLFGRYSHNHEKVRFKYRGKIYKVFDEFIKHGRIYKIRFMDIENHSKYKMEIEDINSFGLIKTVVVEIPVEIPIDVNEIITILSNRIKGAYSALEVIFVTKYIAIQEASLKFLNNILYEHFMKNDKEYLTRHVFFTIFKKNIGYFYFDENKLRYIISSFKNKQDDYISPYDFSTWITTKSMPFQLSLSKETVKLGKTLTQAFNKAKYRIEAEKLWHAVKNLYDSDARTVSPLAISGDYVLVASCASEYKNDIMTEINAVKSILEKQFKKNVKEISIWSRILGRIDTVRIQIPFSDFAAKVIAEYLTRNTQPF